MLAEAGDERAAADARAWAGLAAAADEAAFFSDFANLLGPSLLRARGLVLLLPVDAAGQALNPVAAWPQRGTDLRHLGPVVQRAMQRREPVVQPAPGPAGDGGAAWLAHPVEAEGTLRAVIVVDLAAGAQPAAALRTLRWAAGWLLKRWQQRALDAAQDELSRVATLNDLLATALQQRRLKASALAVANELAARLCCDRVAVGFEDDDRIVPAAISHTATFDARSDLVRALGDAMDEVLDLGVAVELPRPADDESGALAHEQAARRLGTQAMLSVPLVHDGLTLGALSAERHQGPPFTPRERALAHAAGTLLGPVWALQRAAEQPWRRRLRERTREALQTLAGPRHPGLKLASVLLAATLVLLAFWPADHRVAARTVIEGSTQLARVAPFDGFIAESLVRAGDTVRQGQPMARLEDRDLKLEQARWAAELEQAQRKFQVALAQADRGAMGVLVAQSNQAEVQLALVEEKLARSRIVAPFDGVVVSGDLSQQIGTPVEQGRTLFEVAPLTGYRVVLQVDDRDIAHLAVGQPGELVLSSLPDRSLPFTVSAVTSVAAQQDGRNVFRVEAQVQGPAERLRPGMEGIGKVRVGERGLLWIWTHGMVDWLRLALWSWTP